jgi:adenine-specific DNA-methyltransferase
MKLPDNEIRDITKLLEEGKPLPDKYRFMLFGDEREIELVWNGKSQEITNVVLPFQTIEHVDEPRAEESLLIQPGLFDLTSGRQLKGWTNKLIWGDNKFVLSSLKSGPLREEIEANGGIKLIYIDPPFDVGANFSISIEIGKEELSKEPNILEEIAYRDTWNKGNDSFLSMLYERVKLMHGLLSQDGVIAIHIGKGVGYLVRSILDEIFGASHFIDEITWQRSHAHGDSGQGSKHFGRVTETIYLYSKSDNYYWCNQYKPYTQEIISRDYRFIDEKSGERYRLTPVDGPGGASKGNPFYEFLGVKGYWRYSKEKMQELFEAGEIIKSLKGNSLSRKKFLKDAKGTPVLDLWNDLPRIAPMSNESVGYPTQKPEILVERILSTFTKPGDIVCDFFNGSGTTASVAEKLGRKWITSDLGKFAIHTTRKRLIGVQRELKAQDKEFRAFEILNLGKYERQLFITGIDEIDAKTLNQKELNKEQAFIRLIATAYKAEPVTGFRTFRAKKAGRVVAIGPVDMPVSRLFAEQVVDECIEKGITKVDLLGFEFEMGLFPSIQDEAASKGVDLVLKHIPKEVFDKRAVDKGEARFHDVAYIEIRPHLKGNSVAIELTNYSVFYTQGVTSFAEDNLKNGGSQIVVENGQVIKISKDKNGFVNPREVLTKNWHDWIDYWSIDFDFTNRKEIIRVQDPKTGEVKETWTGDYIFENEWQSFRTRQDRTLELKSVFNEVPPGKRKIAVKVVDIFGNDTMKVITVTIGEKR